MKENQTQIKLSVGGMSCSGCELCIEEKLKELPGIFAVDASYVKSAVTVVFDNTKVSAAQIKAAVTSAGYTVLPQKPPAAASAQVQDKKSSYAQAAGILAVVAALYLLISHTVGFNFIPNVSQNMSYGILFVVGLVTSVHCLAMCGGINLAQNVGSDTKQAPAGVKQRLMPGILYNAGRVVSYTLIGGIVGAIGSVVSFSGAAKGVVAIFAGVLMMIMGLNMLNLFPWLRRFNLHMPKFLGRFAGAKKRSRGPFFVGLLNGLMPCGPLQTMQLYALGTGSFFSGALSMLMFSLGTVPLMFLFGALSSLLSSKFTHNMMKVSAALVMALGFVMLTRGLNLSGIQVGGVRGQAGIAVVQNGVQEITTTFKSGRYAPISVQKGVPVKWTIRVTDDDLNGCNNPVVLPEYDIEKELVPGDNLIEFTPQETGTFPYSCWMGMIYSSITVVDDLSVPQNAAAQTPAVPLGPAPGGCCGAA